MMGKTQKVSKGQLLGFVPDYRHAVETVGESEVFVSPAHIDSEDSCAPKRKCVSLNIDKGDSLNAPLQVFSLSKMSGSERKELGMRLKGELEQVQILWNRLLSKNIRGLNGVTVSSSDNVSVKKQELLSQNNSKLNRTSSGKSVTQPPPPPSVNNTCVILMKQCETLLKRLMAHQYGWVFNTPVDVVKLNIPDYFQVIKHEMDLGTIKNKIASSAYSSPWDFVSDVRLTFTNAMTYNPPGNDVHIMADAMSKFFETRWKPIEKKLVASDAAVKKEREEVKPQLQVNKRKASSPPHNSAAQEIGRPNMTDELKLSLSRQLESLVGEMPENMVDFLRQRITNENHASDDEIEIDIDSLSDDTLFEIQKLLDDYLREKQLLNHAKVNPYEMEILNESGLSSSSTSRGKGNELAIEVDIGENNVPGSSFPPAVIEKDMVLRSSKHGSSSSSSSDTGSSCSDSDSSSSSESGSDVKASGAMKENKERMRLMADLDDENDVASNKVGAKRSSNGLNQPEQESTQTDSAEGPYNLYMTILGENAPPERQVSPGKKYRAALLRGRFADTILKAREKTLDQGVKKDPEQLQWEREKLERLKREEKARLKAEAKAAEDARRRAEAAAAAEAVAEAKRKREIEREAARQALQKMEKTVEINEGSLCLKDLEMLGTVPGEHMPSSVGETSPALSERLGAFKIGSNPLEQLGLYMKADEEEEEEVVPGCDPVSYADVEEGEID